MLDALKDFNVDNKMNPDFKVLRDVPTPVWKIIDYPRAAKNLIEELDQRQYLRFPLRYQLESTISNGYLSEYNLGVPFIQRLSSIPESKAISLLECVSERRERVYDPLEIFNWARVKPHLASQKIPSYSVILRRATVTPTTILFAPPSIEYSNRVLRRWAEHSDRFLRVEFREEGGLKLQYGLTATKNDVFTRVHNTLYNGITIGDRHYEFLAFGSSQFREHGAYMFASDKDIKASAIRKWMGSLAKIRSVGKYCARLGQCFCT